MGIFLTQGSNLQLLHWQMVPLPLLHLGSVCVCVCVHVYACACVCIQVGYIYDLLFPLTL